MLHQYSSSGLGTSTLIVFGAILCALLGLAELQWPHVLSAPQSPVDLSAFGLGLGQQTQTVYRSAFVELAKLIVAGLVGLLVAVVHREYHRGRPPTRSLLQAEVLLCVSGALMMIIIGNSAARALGVAGGASIVRFRTPVEDPKDAIVLFLMLGLGMSVGLGAFAVCGMATMFICVFLAYVNRFGEDRPRIMYLELVSSGKEFPLDHVQGVLRRTVTSVESLKFASGDQPVARYSVTMEQNTALSYITSELMAGGNAGLKSVSWEQPKKTD